MTPNQPRRPWRCEARQYSDQMSCHRCALVWDMNDPDPPACEPRCPMCDWLRGRGLEPTHNHEVTQ